MGEFAPARFPALLKKSHLKVYFGIIYRVPKKYWKPESGKVSSLWPDHLALVYVYTMSESSLHFSTNFPASWYSLTSSAISCSCQALSCFFIPSKLCQMLSITEVLADKVWPDDEGEYSSPEAKLQISNGE